VGHIVGVVRDHILDDLRVTRLDEAVVPSGNLAARNILRPMEAEDEPLHSSQGARPDHRSVEPSREGEKVPVSPFRKESPVENVPGSEYRQIERSAVVGDVECVSGITENLGETVEQHRFSRRLGEEELRYPHSG
jgi:hypothetical protein